MSIKKTILISTVAFLAFTGLSTIAAAQSSTSVPGKLADKVCCKKTPVAPPKPKPVIPKARPNSVEFNKASSGIGVKSSRPNQMAIAAKQLRDRRNAQQALTKAKPVASPPPLSLNAQTKTQAAVADLKKVNTPNLSKPQKAEVGGAIRKAEQQAATAKTQQLRASANIKKQQQAKLSDQKFTKTKDQNQQTLAKKKLQSENFQKKQTIQNKKAVFNRNASRKFSKKQKNSANKALEKQFPNYSKRVDKNKAHVTTASGEQYLLPRNLQDQMNLKQAMSNPMSVNSNRMNNDKMFHHSDGWTKRKRYSNSDKGTQSLVSFQYNVKTDKVADIKFDHFSNPNEIKRASVKKKNEN